MTTKSDPEGVGAGPVAFPEGLSRRAFLRRMGLLGGSLVVYFAVGDLPAAARAPGTGYALSEEVHFSNGRLLDVNFDTYRIPRFSWLLEIETVIVPNDALPPKGGGEPAIVCMGGVLATAVHDATGAVVRQLPMTPERVKRAIEEVASSAAS